MTLTGTIVTVLGGAVAKRIAGDWLNDSPLAEKIGEEIIDVVKGAFGEGRVSGQARQIDKLGGEIAARMRVALTVEARRLDEGARAAIEREAAQALRHTRLDLELLGRLNFDGLRVARHIREGYPLNTAGLSRDEQGYFDRVVQEASYGIVSAADMLDTFGVQATTEILDRLDALLNQAARQLEHERRAAEAFEKDYRRTRETDFYILVQQPHHFRLQHAPGRAKVPEACFRFFLGRCFKDRVCIRKYLLSSQPTGRFCGQWFLGLRLIQAQLAVTEASFKVADFVDDAALLLSIREMCCQSRWESRAPVTDNDLYLGSI